MAQEKNTSGQALPGDAQAPQTGLSTVHPDEIARKYAALTPHTPERAVTINQLVVIEQGVATSDAARALIQIAGSQLTTGYTPEAIRDLDHPQFIAMTARLALGIESPANPAQTSLAEALALIGAESTTTGIEPISTSSLSADQMEALIEAFDRELQERISDQRTTEDRPVTHALASLSDEVKLAIVRAHPELLALFEEQEELGEGRKRRGNIAPGTAFGVDEDVEEEVKRLLGSEYTDFQEE